jgi:hypothetical protein
MAKEYFSLKNQVIEFDTDARTMIVVISDDKFKTISVNSMTENVFNSQYLSMKAEVAKALVSNLNVSSSYAPNDSDSDTFNEFKQQALDYFQNNL